MVKDELERLDHQPTSLTTEYLNRLEYNGPAISRYATSDSEEEFEWFEKSLDDETYFVLTNNNRRAFDFGD